MVALDVARAAAAIYVVLHHLAQHWGWTSGLGIMLRFGQEAVVVFFLLSGFVIFANERDRSKDLVSYFIRRFRRIYPTLAAAMVLSVTVAVLNGNLFAEFSWRQLVGTLCSLQDVSSLKPGVIVDPFMGNEPLWSLSYEVAFYLMFPCVIFFWRKYPSRTNTIIGLSSCVALLLYAFAPNHFALVTAYFLVWWCGAMVARAYIDGAHGFWQMDSSIIWLAFLVILSLLVVIAVGYAGLGYYPFLIFRHFAFALFVLLVLFGPIGRFVAAVTMPIKTPASWIASISYGLYVFHYPLLIRWNATQSPDGLLLGFISLCAISYLGDREINRLLPRPQRRPTTTAI